MVINSIVTIVKGQVSRSIGNHTEDKVILVKLVIVSSLIII